MSVDIARLAVFEVVTWIILLCVVRDTSASKASQRSSVLSILPRRRTGAVTVWIELNDSDSFSSLVELAEDED